MGHAPTHLAQRMQGSGSARRASLSFMMSRPLEPFVMGMSKEMRALPIMGPPPIILPVSAGRPPHSSMSWEKGVPRRASRLEGFFTLLPVTVMMREMRGLFFITAS